MVSVNAICLMAGMSLLVTSSQAAGPAPTKSEMALARDWVAKNFRAIPKSQNAPAASSGVRPGLMVLANHDPIAQNKRPDGVPIKIGKAVFERGLLCHAPSKVLVQLPGPGKSFSSIVGIHSDAGGGSVHFSVSVEGKEAFRSGLVRCGDAGIPVSVDLKGATSFTLSVDDGGDGISCDQSDWADARVTLEDGREIWLGDMPIITRAVPKRDASVPPFSFIYNGKHSDSILGGWKFTQSKKKLDRNRTQRTLVYTDPETLLEMRCVLVEYRDYPTVEWTLYLKNTGKSDTPIVEDLLALDTRIQRKTPKEFVLNHNVGTPCTPADYQPLTSTLTPDTDKRIGAAGGRPMNTDMPYFNLEWDRQGMIVVVAWTGQWTSQWTREPNDRLRITAGQEQTRFKLHPGEEVRSPLVVLQFWNRDRITAQNTWRRWMIAHNLPRPGGKPFPPVLSGAGADFFPDLVDSISDELTFVKGCVRERLDYDYWWRDAGWYPCGKSWPMVGTWEPDPVRYPNGLRELADYVHKNDMKFTVWFEPERVSNGSWLAENHPEWLLGGDLLNLGDPDAWNWLVNKIDNLIVNEHIDMYRQDFNMDPLAGWRNNDADDRQGITENKHVVGLYAYWDELKRRHPNMPFDNCASGGRRNDLEMMRRGVPLSKTDYFGGGTSSQCQFYGIASWLPYFGAGTMTYDLYNMRSNIAPWSASGWDTREPKNNFDLVRKYMSECRKVAPYYWGDYYPLTPYSLQDNVWMAWQFDLPEKGKGIVQAFRRAENKDKSMTFRLSALDPKATYELTDFDTPSKIRVSGSKLTEEGLTITTARSPWASIITYRKLGKAK